MDAPYPRQRHRSPSFHQSAANRNAYGYYREMSQVTQTAPSCSRSRRRGEVLERALYEATLAELAEVGYGRLTMEGIAARAHTGKAALYRRWASKHDLVHAALVFALPPVPEPRSGRSARETLLTLFTSHRDVLAGKTAFPGLDTIHQLLHEPEMRAIFADAVVGPRLKIVDSILQAAVETGDIDPAALTPLTARVGPALINHHFLLTGEPPNRRDLALVVDTVIPPRPPARAD
jgi:AcrR family transcriptional regulator